MLAPGDEYLEVQYFNKSEIPLIIKKSTYKETTYKILL